MTPSRTVLFGGCAVDWPTGLPEILAAARYQAKFIGGLAALGSCVAGGPTRAVVVDARALSFGDLVLLRRLRGSSPGVAVLVVGASAASPAMNDALAEEATTFVPRSQLAAALLVALDGLPQHA